MEDFENLVEWFRDSYSQLKGLGVEDKKEVIGYVVIILSVFITFIVSLKIALKGTFKTETRNARKVRKAKALGHVVTGDYVKSTSSYETRSIANGMRTSYYREYTYCHWYKYVVNGKEYMYYHMVVDENYKPRQTLELYYINFPTFAFKETEAVKDNSGCMVLLLPLLVMIVLVYVLKFMGVNFS